MCMFQKLSSILTLFIITILFGFLLQWMATGVNKTPEEDYRYDWGGKYSY